MEKDHLAPSMSQRAHYFTASSKRLVPYYLVEIASHVYNQSWLMTKAVPTNNNCLCWLISYKGMECIIKVFKMVSFPHDLIFIQIYNLSKKKKTLLSNSGFSRLK